MGVVRPTVSLSRIVIFQRLSVVDHVDHTVPSAPRLERPGDGEDGASLPMWEKILGENSVYIEKESGRKFRDLLGPPEEGICWEEGDSKHGSRVN